MPFGTGAVARTLDKRDYRLALAGAPYTRPARFMPDYSLIPVKMQGKYGTCGGHAGSMMESILDSMDLSPKYLWKQIKLIDGITNLNYGTDMRSIFKALNNVGDCHESLCANDLETTIEQYTDPAKITDAMKIDAYPQGIDNYAFTGNPTWEQIQDSILQHRAVIARVNCGDGWWTSPAGVASWQEKDILPLRLGNLASGHFIVLWGYDENYIYFRNSWSGAWGRVGDGYFDRSYLKNVLEIGAGIASVSVKQKLINLYTQVVLLLTKMVAQLKG